MNVADIRKWLRLTYGEDKDQQLDSMIQSYLWAIEQMSPAFARIGASTASRIPKYQPSGDSTDDAWLETGRSGTDD